MKSVKWLVVGSVVFAGACQDVTEPVEPVAGPAASVQGPQGDEQAELARAVPGFGGFFFDAAGQPTAYLVDRGSERALRARIGQLSAMARRSGAELVIRPGRFGYAQLEAGHARASHAALPLAGTVFTDLDEARNLVVVGVAQRALVPGARAALARAGLDEGSYDVVVTEPIYQVASLRDEFDPTVGGIQIHFTRYLCTLGANVLDGTQRSFITNSHCTAKQGGVQGTVYYQPTSSVDGAVIATEVEDPVYVKGGVCPKGRNCRYSDSSRALYAATQSSTLGAIAVTGAPNNGSLTVAGNVSVNGTASAAVGATVNKVGRTTGWTQAPVTRTCVNTGVSGTTIVQLCQTWVQHASATIVGGGDSGSSVWTGSGSVKLVGLLWGGSTDGRTFIFSPWDRVEQELGQLTEN